jgi:hypothetical protein
MERCNLGTVGIDCESATYGLYGHGVLRSLRTSPLLCMNKDDAVAESLCITHSTPTSTVFYSVRTNKHTHENIALAVMLVVIAARG